MFLLLATLTALCSHRGAIAASDATPQPLAPAAVTSRGKLSATERWARAPGFVKTLYFSFQREGSNELYNHSSTAWTFSNTMTTGQNKLQFNLQSQFGKAHRPLMTVEDLIQANFRLFRRPRSSLRRRHGPASVVISFINKHGRELAAIPPTQFTLQDGVLQVSVTNLFHNVNLRLLSRPRRMRLKIRTYLLKTREEIESSDVFDLSSQTTTRPLVVLYARKNEELQEKFLMKLRNAISGAARRKRQAEGSSAKEQTPVKAEGCQLHDLIVDFSKIEWDHVLSPRTFNAFDCRGSCRMPFSSTKNHAIIRSWVWLKTPPSRRSAKLNVCCVPSEYRQVALALEVHNSGNYQVTSYSDMQAKKCSCT